MSRVKLGEVAVECRDTIKGTKQGLPVVGLEHLIPNEVTLTGWSNDSNNTFSKVFSKGQVLFGRRRAYLKKAAVAPFDGICSGDITVIAAKTERILPELLPFIIQNDRFFDFAIEKSAGSLSPRAKWEHIKDFEFELPSLAEQGRLAEILWASVSVKEAYEKLLFSTDELVKSQFIELFGGCKNIRKLREVAEITAGQGSPPEDAFISDGMPFIKAGDIGELLRGEKNESDCYQVSDETAKQYKLKLKKPGTILFAKSGMSCMMEYVYITKASTYIVSHLACVFPIKEICLSEYITLRAR